MIAEKFDARTLANMNTALETACRGLRSGSQKHRARRHIASRIIKCAEKGNGALGALTAVALTAANELRSKRDRASSPKNLDL
jgi:hypothetical protein